jgi:hypothetical protein
MWTIQIVPFAAIPVKAVSDAKPRKAKPKNEHQGRMSLYVDGLSVHCLILKQEMLVVAIVETTYFLAILTAFLAENLAIMTLIFLPERASAGFAGFDRCLSRPFLAALWRFLMSPPLYQNPRKDARRSASGPRNDLVRDFDTPPP